jgi:hypothetical protein
LHSARSWRPKQTLLDQLRALVAEDPDFLTDLIEGDTDLLELIAALEASILDDETLVDGAKAALDKLQACKRAVEIRIELKRRLLAQTLQQIGLTILRTPTYRGSQRQGDCRRPRRHPRPLVETTAAQT